MNLDVDPSQNNAGGTAHESEFNCVASTTLHDRSGSLVILFHEEYYRANNPNLDESELSPWEHFCRVGFRNNRNPHPLFDTRFYRDRYLSEHVDINPLQHYAENAEARSSTHPLLDIEYYIGQLDNESIQAKLKSQTWLEFFLAHNHRDLKSPSREFSSERYVDRYSDVFKSGENPLAHYLTKGLRQGRLKFHDWNVNPPIFDQRYYRETNPDLDLPDQSLWRHYCKYGFKENRNPHPVFHTAYYRQKYLSQTPDINPVDHYLQQSEAILDTHPLFDASFYLSQISVSMSDLRESGETPLEHFLQHSRANLASSSPLFSVRRYLEKHEDLAPLNVNPLYHFIVHGQGGRRQSFVDTEHLNQLRFKSEYELELMSGLEVFHQRFITSMVNASLRQTVVCVSHEASQTGAPAIILKVAERLHDKYDIDIVNILCRGGELVPQFEKLGPTLNLDGRTSNHLPGRLAADIDLFHELISNANVLGVLVNSAESRFLLPTLHELNVPIHSLIHENARCYPDGEFDLIAEYSDLVVVPSDYVRGAALENTEFESGQIEVVPQGLLKEQLLEIEPVDKNLDLRKTWNVPTDATLVLGCGTRDGRKGMDLFISTAIVALNQAPKGSLYFRWLGGRSYGDNTDHAFWATKDLATAGIEEFVQFLDPTEDVAPCFQASDMLFLPSRIDPFPCVVNEAMAAGKPIILFENGSGCVDLVKNEGGIVVPFGNVALAADAIGELAKFPTLRQQMGTRNRQYVQQNMNFDDYVATLLNGLVASMGNEPFQLIKTEAYQSLFHHMTSQTDPDAKKVIFALPAWNISGVNTFVENLILELRKSGYDASILFTTRNSGKIERSHLPRVPYRYLTTMTMKPEEQRDRVEAYLRLNAPCVFVPNYDYISSSIASRLPDDVGVLGVLHCDDDEHYLHGYQLGHYWNAMVAVSETIRSKMLQLNPAFQDRVHTIRYGIPAEANPVWDRSENDERIRIIYTGRMIQQQKRILDFIELTKQLESRQVPFELTFIGDGPQEQVVKDALASLASNQTVRFLGRQTPERVIEELKMHDVLVLTSEFEGLPLSLLEAMAHGCVAAVTEIPSGISEILTHRENAMLSPVGDLSKMANNIAELHRDRTLLGQLRDKGFQTLWDQQLTAPQMAQQYAQVLETIFGEIADQSTTNTIPLHCPHVSSMLNAA